MQPQFISMKSLIKKGLRMEKIFNKIKIKNRKNNITDTDPKMNGLPESYDEEIYLGYDGRFIHSCKEEMLDILLLDDDEIEYMGWKPYRKYLIDSGLITDTDIDIEKADTENDLRKNDRRKRMLDRLDEIKADNPEALIKFNEIRVRHGKEPRQ